MGRRKFRSDQGEAMRAALPERVAFARGAATPRGSIWEWAQALLLGANLAWTTLSLGGYLPETKVVIFALTALLLVVHLAACAVEGRPVRDTDPLGWCLLPFVGYVVFNAAFLTPVPWLGWIDALNWLNLVACFWVTRNGLRAHGPRRTVFFVLVFLGLGAVFMACHQRFVQPDWLMLGRHQVPQFLERASGPFGIPNSLAGFLLLLLPAAGARAFGPGVATTARVWWGWVTSVLVFGLLLTVSRGGWMALAVALAVWPLLARGWAWRRRVFTGVVVTATLLATSAVVLQNAPAARARFQRLLDDSGELSRPVLWRAAWHIFREHPILGGGAGSFNVRFESHRPAGFVDNPQWVHNEYLNTLSDYGLTGLVLALGGTGLGVIRRRRLQSSNGSLLQGGGDSRALWTGAGIGLLAFALQLGVDFHLKIPALAMAFAVMAALAPGRPAQAHARAPGKRERAGWIVAAVFAAAVLSPLLRLCRAEALRHHARETLDRHAASLPHAPATAFAEAEAQLRRATALAPGHAQAWSDLAHAIQMQAAADPGRVAALAHPAELAARRATELGAIVPEFWIRLGISLDMQGRSAGAADAFERALQLAPRSSPAWYHYAYHLSFATEERARALRAIATCLSLDPGNAAAEALRSKLNERPAGALTIP